MFNIRVANKEDHAEQITNNNCAMALETENKILDEATAKFGVSRVFDNKELGFYLVAESKGGVIASLMSGLIGEMHFFGGYSLYT